jgi:nitrite reductase (NADH) small subunit
MTTSTVPVLDSTTNTGSAFDGCTATSRDETSPEWVEVCPIDKILPDTGVCVLVDDNQVAVFHLQGGEVYAIGNLDPFSNAAVLSRGIVGDSRGIPKVASPIYKQSFDLRSGTCLDDDSVQVPVFRTRVTDGIVQVSVSPTHRGDTACPPAPGAG